MTEETIKTIPLDRAKLEPIVKLALENGRMISTEGMEKETWLGLRILLGIGGSDVAVALGISKYKTAYQIWQEKVADEIEYGLKLRGEGKTKAITSKDLRDGKFVGDLK